jgi:hypothetical protein
VETAPINHLSEKMHSDDGQKKFLMLLHSRVIDNLIGSEASIKVADHATAEAFSRKVEKHLISRIASLAGARTSSEGSPDLLEEALLKDLTAPEVDPVRLSRITTEEVRNSIGNRLVKRN